MENYIKKLRDRQDLSESEIQAAMSLIMGGKIPDEQIESFLLELNKKSIVVNEVAGAAKLLREFSIEVKTKHTVVLDMCGTGGDAKGTFNISTVSTFVVAGAGVVVAKHGNRSVSSKCGSADVLEALGVRINLNAEQLGKSLDEIGLAFLFAPQLHPAMKNVAQARKNLGVKTIFNVLGPLLNPAKATHQLIGVYADGYRRVMAEVLRKLGIQRTMVVFGSDGLDEITLTGDTYVTQYDKEGFLEKIINPRNLGFTTCKAEDLKGGDVSFNADIVVKILAGKMTGPRRDIVVLNSAYGLYCAEYVKNISDGIKKAEESIDSGKALKKLEELKTFTNGLSQ